MQGEIGLSIDTCCRNGDVDYYVCHRITSFCAYRLTINNALLIALFGGDMSQQKYMHKIQFITWTRPMSRGQQLYLCVAVVAKRCLLRWAWLWIIGVCSSDLTVIRINLQCTSGINALVTLGDIPYKDIPNKHFQMVPGYRVTIWHH